MDEYVLTAGLGLNKSVTLRRVEPFDSAGRHHCLLASAENSNAIALSRSLIRQALSCGTQAGCARSNASSNPPTILFQDVWFNVLRRPRIADCGTTLRPSRLPKLAVERR